MKFTLVFSLFASSVFSLALDPVVERDICPSEYPIVQVFISTKLVNYPVLVSTFIPADTTININGGVTININNAPTNLSTIVTGSSTTTYTEVVTATVTTTVGVPTPTSTPFQISLVSALLLKRQVANGYIVADGTTTPSCNNAAVFTLESGQLFNNGELVSTNSNTTAQIFAGSPIVGSISTTFQLTNNVLSWVNPSFSGGAATICLVGGIIEAVFTASLPSGCAPQILEITPASACRGGSPTTSLTSASSSTSLVLTTSTNLSTSTSTPSNSSTSTIFETTTGLSSTVTTTTTDASSETGTTSTSSSFATPTLFTLQVTGAGIDGEYAQIAAVNDTTRSNTIVFTPSIGNASFFSLDIVGHLLDAEGDYANQDPVDPTNPYPYALYLNPPNTVLSNNFSLPTCSFSTSGLLSCSETDSRDVLQYCAGLDFLFLNQGVYPNCTEITLTGASPTLIKRGKRLIHLT